MNKLNFTFKTSDLIAKRLKGKLSQEEGRVLDKWKYENEANLALYHRLSKNPESNYFKNEDLLENSKKDEIWNKIES